MATEQVLKASADAAQFAYQNGALPAGYSTKGTFSDPNTGAYAIIGQNAAGHVIVAFRGTEDLRDANADAQLGRSQYQALLGLGLTTRLNVLKTESPYTRIDFIGHSLGGGLAQYAAYDFARSTSAGITTGLFTYNAFGGVAGIKAMNNGIYDATVAGRIDAFNLWAMGLDNNADVVTRLVDDGHVGGNTRRVDVAAASPFEAHTSNNLAYIPSFSSLPAQTPDYLHIDAGRYIAGSIATLLNYPQDGDYLQALNTAATVFAALGAAPRNDVDQVLRAATGNDLAGWLGTFRDAALFAIPHPGVRAFAWLMQGLDALDRVNDATGASLKTPPGIDALSSARSYVDARQWRYDYGDGRSMVLDRTTGALYWGLPTTDGKRVLIEITPDAMQANMADVRYSYVDANLNLLSRINTEILDSGERVQWHEDAAGSITRYDLTHTVKSGETLASIAVDYGLSETALRNANAGMGASAISGDSLIVPVYTPNFGVPADNTRLTIGTNTAVQTFLPGAEAEGALATSVNNGYLIKNTDHWAQMPIGILNANGTTSTVLAGIAADSLRPGNHNLMPNGVQPVDADYAIQLAMQGMTLLDVAKTNNVYWDATGTIYVDPLVLDLNGDGVRLTDYASNPVLFDIDNDGGSQEVSGWVSAQDGILVMDRNGNGRIDNIAETFSEYFNGLTGTGGNAGTKPYSDGFAALKSQDSNSDNLFTSADTAFNNVRVWIDADHDGVTDAGELQTLSALNITQINLTPKSESGLVRDGNEILSSGSFIQGGVTKEALAASFIADPGGHTFVTSGTGTQDTSQTGVTSYTAGNTAGETIDVTVKGVTNAYGAQGNDTLIGNAANNWLAGGAGSDSYSAGAGDDVLLIDADDLQQNIRAGAGTDIVQVIGDQGVTLDLAQAEVEVAVGGRGNDVFVSGGNSNTFVRAGDGDDLLLGGSANDALSGENGDDVIDGGAGNDLLRGHRGRDRILGGSGDDIIEGGQDDDTLSGGAGNDVIEGGEGDDRIDGGAGVDLAKYTGGYADYRITRTEQGVWVSDTKGRDGTDFLVNVENINFEDIGTISLTLPNPLPVRDIVAVAGRTAPVTISKSRLLGNDIDYQGDVLSITQVLGASGGTAVINANGDVVFTPDASYKGIMSFKYKIKDSLNNAGMTLVDPVSGATPEIRAQVILKTPDMPDDPYVTEQRYLGDINVLPVWQDYTGKGIQVGVFEPGDEFSVDPETFDYRNPDLAPNVDPAWLNQVGITTTFSNHTTGVAGVIAAARNGEGTVGVAYGAQIAGQPISQNETGSADLNKMQNFDVVNNSWGTRGNFGFQLPGFHIPGILNAVGQGRGGLGTAIVFAAGNDRATGGNTNYDVLTNSPFIITVAATNPAYDGDVSVPFKTFSSPGASILVSAPGSYLSTLAREFINENGSTFGNDYEAWSGTSFSAPVVSGVVALMLEANPTLGFRDIQEILALSAIQTGDSDWTFNTARTWNGGGMHVSHDYGFGQVDALAAVRLAETWTQAKTIRTNDPSYDEISSGILTANNAIPDATVNAPGLLTKTVTMDSGLEVEYAQVVVNIDHQRWGDLIVKLISPSGTQSVLIDRPGKAPGSGSTVYGDTGTVTLNTALGTTHVRGEQSGGNWTLQIYDAATGQAGVLKDWVLKLSGKPGVGEGLGNDTYVYTNEFAGLGLGARATLVDASGGADTINAAAVSGNSNINLFPGMASTIAGRTLTLTTTTYIENAVGGDGNDVLTGNDKNNNLSGGRGSDTLYGNVGIDILDGGAGNDTLYGGTERDYFVIRKQTSSQDVIGDFSQAGSGEKIVLVGFDNLQDFSQIGRVQEGVNLRLNLGGGQSVLLNNLSTSQFTEQNVVLLYENQYAGDVANWLLDRLMNDVRLPLQISGSALNDSYPLEASPAALFTIGGNDVVWYGTGQHFIDAGDGNDTVLASGSSAAGPKWIEGGAGDDIADGGASDDVIRGGSGNDAIAGYAGFDYVEGGAGNDRLSGGEGDDILIGGIGNDRLSGDAGDDLIYLDGDQGEIWRSGGNQVISGAVGGSGSDWFSIMPNATSSYVYVSDYVYANNLITDFNVNDANEKIDLSSIDSVAGFEDLIFSETGPAGARITTIDAGGGVFISLYNVPVSALNATHFEFSKGNTVAGRTSGADVLTGDAGANLLDGRAGADILTGRTGDDTYVVDNAGDVVNELADGGFDTVRSSISFVLPADVENLVLTGTAAINGTGNAQVNRIEGNAAANILDGGAGEDTLIGGAGNDIYLVDNTADQVKEFAGGGLDAVTSSVSYTLPDEVERLTLTGLEAINATGNALNNTLTGNANNNVLDGAAGVDTLIGGLGDDTYVIDAVGDVVSEVLNQGVDTVYAMLNHTLANNVENLVLGLGVTNGTGNGLANSITGNSLANTLNGGAGNDVLDGRTGADTLIGGAGDDTYLVENAGDIVTEALNAGTDTVESTISLTLAANVENLVLGGVANLNGTGNTLNNTLIGNSGNNTLTGNAGNDVLDGAGGADTLVGGLGNDVYIVDAGDVVTELAGEGTDTVNVGMSYTLLANFENLTLIGADAINGTGNSLNNVMVGNAANNILDGGAGNDTLTGGEGNDVYLFGRGGGQDTINSYDATAGKLDIIRLASGIAPMDVTTTRNNDDLVLSINATTDKLTVSNYFNSDAAGPYKVEQITFADGTIWDPATVKAKVITATEAADKLYGYATNDVLNGLGGNDTLYGRAGDDALSGGAGIDSIYGEDGNDTLNGGTENDTLVGGNGNDVIDGGAGNDSLTGDAGNDTYLFGRTSGQDTINNYDAAATKLDVVQFSADVAPADVIVTRSVDSLILSIAGTTGRLTLTNYFQSDGTGSYRIEQIKFADGTIWDAATIKAKAIVPTAGADNIYGYATNDTLNGLGGNDMLSGREGDDVLDGGTGNDSLTGDAGNDTYLFSRGGGQDTINNYDITVGKLDVLQFTAGVAPADVIATRNNDDLYLAIAGTADKVTVSGYFVSDGAGPNRMEQIRFSDGTVWDVATVKAKVVIPTEGNDNLYGYATADVLNGLGGNDAIYGRAGNDMIDGGIGNDTLAGEAGNDTFLFSRGGGQDVINAYDAGVGKVDILQFAANIAPADVIVTRSADNLILSILGTTDRVTVNNYFIGDASSLAAYKIEQIKFADGTIWDPTVIKAKAITPTAGADLLYGYATNDVLDGLGGNDTLYGRAGNDSLSGGADNDSLFGEAGLDVLDGGAGNDSLTGGAGSDTYLFGRGSGADTLFDYDTLANTDLLSLGTTITTDQMWFRRVGSNLEVSVIGTDDKVTINSWYTSNAYHVEQFKTADGKTLLDSRVDNLVNAMAAFAPPAAGQTTLPPDYQTQLNPVIAANWQ